MNKRHLEHLPAFCGVVFAALLVLAAAAFPSPPGDDAAARSPAWLAAHLTPAAIQGYLRALAALAFVALAVAVARAIRRERGERSLLARAALLGGAFYGLLLLTAQAVAIGAEIAAHEQAAPDAVRALGFLQDGVLAISSLPAVALFGAAGAAFLNAGLVPRWLGWLSLAGVPLGILDAASFSGSPFESVGVLGLAYFLVWAIAAGTTLLVRDGGDASRNDVAAAGLAAG